MDLGKRKLKVCQITTVHNVLDDRIFYRECASLAKKGHEVYLIGPHDKNEVREGVHIIGIPSTTGRVQRFFLSSLRAFRQARKLKSDVYHFHDPELIFVGMLLSIFGSKVIYDVHEDLPKQIYTKPWLRSDFIKRIFSVIISVSEKIAVSFFTGVVAVTEDIANRFPKGKTIVIKNYAIVGLIDAQPAAQRENENVFQLIYVGGIAAIRSIRELINAMELLKGKAELIVAGSWVTPELHEECKKLPGYKYVKYLGHLPIEDVYKHIKAADAGSSLFYPVKNFVTGIPIKSFEYMACGKPMLMSDWEHFRKIYKDTALYLDPLATEKIAEAIEYLIANPEVRKSLGEKARKLVLENYSWEKESEKLEQFYLKICAA